MENEKKEITISQIAEELQVSSTTVSRALSGKGRVSEKTKTMIRNYLESHDIVPNIRTSSFISKTTKCICITLPKEENYAEMAYFNRILMQMYDYFAVRSYSVMIVKTEKTDIEDLKTVVRRHSIDGVILTRIIPGGEEIAYLKEKQVPFVVIGSYPDHEVYQVDADQRKGSHDLVEILIKKNFRKIALFSASMEQTVSQNRRDGFLDALRENDIPIEKKLIVENAGNRNILEKAVNDILKEQTECIICSDDGVCLSLLNYLHEINITVPGNISVASLYNSAVLEEYYPPITSLEFDIREWTKAAGYMLLNQMDGVECEKKTTVGYKILLKESTILFENKM